MGFGCVTGLLRRRTCSVSPDEIGSREFEWRSKLCDRGKGRFLTSAHILEAVDLDAVRIEAVLNGIHSSSHIDEVIPHPGADIAMLVSNRAPAVEEHFVAARPVEGFDFLPGEWVVSCGYTILKSPDREAELDARLMHGRIQKHRLIPCGAGSWERGVPFMGNRKVDTGRYEFGRFGLLSPSYFRLRWIAREVLTANNGAWWVVIPTLATVGAVIVVTYRWWPYLSRGDTATNVMLQHGADWCRCGYVAVRLLAQRDGKKAG